MKKISYAVALVVITSILWACTKDVDNNEVPSRKLDMATLQVDYTDLINTAAFGGWNMPGTNNARVALGRALFYDNKLSLNNTVSCGSCHKQQFGFADNVAFSDGFKGVNALRNSQPINNISSFSGSLFWDGRADSLGQLVTMPITNHIEMGFERLENLPTKLEATDYYPQLFQDAFGTSNITVQNIGTALRDFIFIITSKNSRFEQMSNSQFAGNTINIWTTPPTDLTGFERIGFDVFIGKGQCSSCHSGNNLEGWDAANTGLDLHYSDKGAGAINPAMGEGTFRVPQLRNIALTAPYMHDGRFKTLEEVIDFYDHGVQPHANLDARLREGWQGGVFGGPFEGDGILLPPNGGTDGSTTVVPRKLNLTPLEKKGLVAFLNTLTDYTMVTEQRYSNPFRAK
jgi:cytochrome c peroxidase